MTVGERIASLRRKNGISRSQLADKSGVAVSTISSIENSSRIPGLKIASKIAKVFNLHAEDLLTKDDSTLVS
ncbi:MAG: helix-turn-helix domain-containing protein [Lactobacillus sp.]|nr:helix-turn-helix domain-containing protein [Lactobacillus sp.]